MVKLIHGNDIYVIEKKVKALAKDFLFDLNELNYVKYDMSLISIDEVLLDLNSLPLGVEKKVVVIDHVVFLSKGSKNQISDEEVEELIEFINADIEDIELIIIVRDEKIDDKNKVVTAIKNRGKIITANLIKIEDWPTAAENFFNKENVTITNEAINELIYRTSGNTLVFFNEAKKLVNYKKSITLEDVIETVNRPLESENFALSNAVVEKNTNEALRIYRDYIKQGMEPIVFIAQLASSFRLFTNVYILSDLGMSNEQIATRLAIHPYRVKLALKNRRGTTYKEVLEQSEKLYQLDLDIKSGKVDRHLGFEFFLLNY